MLADFLKDYLSIIIFLFVALTLSIGFIVLNFLFSPKNPDSEKLSAYECGFEAFGDSRMEFDVRFYLVAILFIIFDLENSLRLDGETGPYLLYTFARATSILEKAKNQPKIEFIEDIHRHLSLQHEIELIKNMSKIDLIIEESVINMSPMRIAKFTYNFCNLFNSFYEKSPVLHEEDKDIMNARLYLVNSFKDSLEILFDLLGIEYLKRI